MWGHAQFAAVTEQPAATTALVSAAALMALYSCYHVVKSVLSDRAIRRALVKQGIHQPSSTLPLLGNTLDVALYQHDRLHDWMTEQSIASGGRPWLLSILGRPPTLVFTSPEVCEDVFKTQFDIFGRGDELLDVLHDLFGDGIVGVDGAKWKEQRRVGSHLFSMQMLRDVMDEVVIEKTQQLCDVLSSCAKQGKVVSIKSLLSKFTSDVFTKIGFGVDLHGLSGDVDVEYEHPFIQAVAGFGPVFQSRANSPMWFWKLKRFLSIGDEGQFKKDAKIVHNLIRDIMVESMANKTAKARDSKTPPRRDLLTLYVESSGTTDVMAVRDIVMNFFLAGKDTTSFSMSWFFVMLNRHPRVLHKIREEIRTNLPALATGELNVPTMEDLQKLPYLEAAIKESLRLYMSAVHRTPSRSTTLSDGTFVPFGTYVIMSAYAAGRMTSTWGPDAAEFRPERMLDPETGKVKNFSPFKLVSFIGGPRQCLGMRFAILEMKTAMATVLSRFDITTVEDPFDITYEISLVIPVKGDLRVTVNELAPSPAAS